jgi:hypothetical protein
MLPVKRRDDAGDPLADRHARMVFSFERADLADAFRDVGVPARRRSARRFARSPYGLLCHPFVYTRGLRLRRMNGCTSLMG